MQGFFGELLDCAARSRSIAPLFNLAAARLGNTVVLLDADFTVLARSTVFPITDPPWAETVRQGHFNHEIVSVLRWRA